MPQGPECVLKQSLRWHAAEAEGRRTPTTWSFPRPKGEAARVPRTPCADGLPSAWALGEIEPRPKVNTSEAKDKPCPCSGVYGSLRMSHYPCKPARPKIGRHSISGEFLRHHDHGHGRTEAALAARFRDVGQDPVLWNRRFAAGAACWDPRPWGPTRPVLAEPETKGGTYEDAKCATGVIALLETAKRPVSAKCAQGLTADLRRAVNRSTPLA